jgi:hypothetical protein
MVKMKTVVCTAVGLSASAWIFAQTDSIKETDRFIKAGGATSQAVAHTSLQTKSALEAYNALVQGSSKDLKGDYKKLQNAQKDMNNHVTDTRKTVDEMDKQAGVYFAARSEAIGQIQDAAMRDQAKSRLDASKTAYDNVKTSLKSAGDALAPFTKDLSDQIKYLGAELTPSAAASLKPQGERLNKQGATLFAQADAAVTAANKYFASLRAE